MMGLWLSPERIPGVPRVVRRPMGPSGTWPLQLGGDKVWPRSSWYSATEMSKPRILRLGELKPKSSTGQHSGVRVELFWWKESNSDPLLFGGDSRFPNGRLRPWVASSPKSGMSELVEGATG